MTFIVLYMPIFFIIIICLGLLIVGVREYGYKEGWRDREKQYLSKRTVNRIINENKKDIYER